MFPLIGISPRAPIFPLFRLQPLSVGGEAPVAANKGSRDET